MHTKYTERLKIPAIGTSDINFVTFNGLLIATGYEKIIFHNKMPYIQFNEKNLNQENIHIPNSQKWRAKDNSSSLYIEYRSKDYCNVKIIVWKNNLDLFYASPFDLKSDQIPILIDPLYRKKTILQSY